MTALARQIAAAHREFAGRPAVLTPHGAWTFAQLGARARAMADGLARLGLRPGDRVLIALDNSAEVPVVEHGVWLGGFVRVAVTTRLHPREVETIAGDCAAAALVCEDALGRRLSGLPPGCRVIVRGAALDGLLAGTPGAAPAAPPPVPGDLVALMYTSGSTGRPKGARVTAGAWLAMLAAMRETLPVGGAGQVVLHSAPMSHFGGSVGCAYTLAGAATLPLPRFDPAAVLAAVERHRVTALPLVPTMLARLTGAAAEGHWDLSSLRAVVYGAEPITVAAALRAQRAFGDVLYQCYGLSEALAPLTVLSAADHARGDPARLASAGRPVGSVRLTVLGRDGAPAAPGVPGDVVVSGPQVTAGYWGGRPALPAGPLGTGDVGFLDEDGYLTLVGRRGEAISTGGFTVYPAEVEQAIATLHEVAAVAVTGVPDDTWGEAVAAAVVPRPGAALTEADVRRACARRLAPYKKPRHVVLMEELPLTGTGKVERRRLRALFAAGTAVDSQAYRRRRRDRADGS